MNATEVMPNVGRAHGWADGSRRDRSAVFRAARRHSRFVRLWRIALPLLVVLTAAGLGAVSWLDPLRALSRLPGASASKLVISGRKITMELPRLAGYTRDSRAYELTASAAAQDITNPSLVEMKDIRGKFALPDGSDLELTAANGIYDTRSEIVTMTDNIVLISSSGYEGHLSRAVLDIRRGNVTSDKPVNLKLLNGILDAQRFEVSDSGDVMRFDGGVRLTLRPEAVSAGPQETGRTSP